VGRPALAANERARVASEMLVSYTQRHNPEDRELNQLCHECLLIERNHTYKSKISRCFVGSHIEIHFGNTDSSYSAGLLGGRSGFDSRTGLGIFLFTTTSGMVLGSTQPPIQWASGAFSLGVKWPGRESDHSLPSSAEVKE
jgi:hypothetical protein